MKHLTLCLLLPLLLACGRRQGEVVISGRIEGLNRSDFLIYSLDDGRAAIDTIHLINGRFEYVALLTGQATYHILLPNYSEIVFTAAEGDEIEISGQADKLRQVQVSGNTAVAVDTVATPIDSCLIPRVGYAMPDFKFGADSTALVVTLDSLRGHNTMIVVWASWCGNHRLTRVREALHDDDSLHAYTLSLDTDYHNHRRQLRADSAFSNKYAARWHATHNRLGIADSLVNAWGIVDLPCYIMVDTAGIVTSLQSD